MEDERDRPCAWLAWLQQRKGLRGRHLGSLPSWRRILLIPANR